MLVAVPAPEWQPGAVYLARLAARSRRTMLGALQTVARLLTGDRADAWSLNWPGLGYQHVQAVRTALVEVRGLAPPSANLHLSAVRGVLKEAWRLGLMSAEAVQRAGDVSPVRGRRCRGAGAGRWRAAGAFRCVRAGRASGSLRDAALLALLY